MKPTKQHMKCPAPRRGKRQRPDVQVDLASILSIDHACLGCAPGEPCCCATYEVCVNTSELDRIIRVLPEVAKLCPHLETNGGYDNIFDSVGSGLYALDTNEDGLCVLAFESNHTIRCSLHAVAATLGLPLDQVKPKACLLWPLGFSEGDEVLSLTDGALSFRCNSRKRKQSRCLSPGFVEAIELVYGEGCGTMVEAEAARGVRHTKLPRSR